MEESPNRLREHFERCPHYWFNGPQRRLAREAGVSEKAVSCLLRGKTGNPTWRTVRRVTAAPERRLGVRLDPRDVFGN